MKVVESDIIIMTRVIMIDTAQTAGILVHCTQLIVDVTKRLFGGDTTLVLEIEKGTEILMGVEDMDIDRGCKRLHR